MSTDPLQRIRERGYWRVIIRPTTYRRDLLPNLRELEAAVRASVVQVRGWDYPHWPRDLPARLNDGIEASTDWQDRKEYWKAFRSGQFLHYFAMREDWLRENEGVRRIDLAPRSVLAYDSTIYTVTEIFLFAARWAARAGLGSQARIEISLLELAGRHLYTFDANRVPFDDYRRADAGRFDHAQVYSSDDLLANPPELAIPVLRRLFELLHWDAPEESLRDFQRKAMNGVR